MSNFAWTALAPLRLGANARNPKGGGPETVARYGVLRAGTGGMMLRFCDGRPVSATTEAFLGWVCEALARGEAGIRPGVGQHRVARERARAAVDRGP
ncbi:hypothetical protein J8F10_05930 [Gemmata sp. G18]|uniref:Uncharacterized protein n=1 Tax=Gemmata palustris TaxID=2822762 RepID=A0ABS5BM82_9BACT|nr:hypothetical protein [Gemmata palustris]MBP3954820.1 hypothetical protein [Gemmata palustris]